MLFIFWSGTHDVDSMGVYLDASANSFVRSLYLWDHSLLNCFFMCMDIFFDVILFIKRRLRFDHHKKYERHKYVPKSLPVSIPLSNSVMAFRVSLYSSMYMLKTFPCFMIVLLLLGSCHHAGRAFSMYM